MSAPTNRGAGRPRDPDLDAAILDAAAELLVEQGYLQLRIEEVASRAGVAKSSIYRRWPGKEELCFDAIDRVKGPVPKLPGTSVRDDLFALLDAMRGRWGSSLHGRMMQRLAIDAIGRPELYERYRQRIVAPYRQIYRQVLSRGAQDGEIRSDYNLEWVVDLLVGPTIIAMLTQRGRITRTETEFAVDVVMSWLSQR